MKEFLIRGIDPQLRKDFKTACAHFGISMRDTLIKHMENIVSDYDRTLINRTFEAHQRRKGGKKK